MGCSASTPASSASPKSGVCPPAPQQQLSPEAEAALTALAERPRRAGKYFAVHRSLLSQIEYTSEPVDAATEFWPHHPNSGHPLLNEFVMARLTDEQIRAQHHLVRLSSYRWEGVRGVGPKGEWATPTNYGWFLELCKEHGWIGWLDFMANVVVNVPPAETVAYMGSLYAECTVVPQGLYSPATLLAAMSRAWVFQETALGPLDESGVRHMLDSICALGERVRAGEAEVLLGAFAEVADGLTRLLERRGWLHFVFAEKRQQLTMATDYQASDWPGCNKEVVADTLVQRCSCGAAKEERLGRRQLLERKAYPRKWKLYQQVLAMVKKVAPTTIIGCHVLDYFTRPAPDNSAEPLVRKLLTTSRHEGCKSVGSFLGPLAAPVLRAYATLEVTYEADRKAAVTSVALSILEARFGMRIGAEELLRMAWVASAREGGGGLSIVGIQPTIPDGERLLGLGCITGTPILASHQGNPTCYKTVSGEVHDTNVVMGKSLGLAFSRSAHTFTDAAGQRYRGFVCNFPASLAAQGKRKVCVWRRVGDPAGRPAVVSVLLAETMGNSEAPVPEEEAFD